jgi:hypothetical protein
MSLISDMAVLDAEIFEALGEWFLVGGVRTQGVFQDSFVDQSSGGEGTVEGREVLFTCRRSGLPTLTHRVTTFVSDPDLGDMNHGSWVFLRGEPDESGIIRCVLGK